jgi:hypothetical protein
MQSCGVHSKIEDRRATKKRDDEKTRRRENATTRKREDEKTRRRENATRRNEATSKAKKMQAAIGGKPSTAKNASCDPRHEFRAKHPTREERDSSCKTRAKPSFFRPLYLPSFVPYLTLREAQCAKRNSQFSPLRPANRNSHCAKRYPPFESGGTRRAALEGRNTQNSHTRNSHDPQFTTSFLRTFRPYYVRTFLRSYIPPAQRPYPRYLRSVFPSVPAFGLSLVLVFSFSCLAVFSPSRLLFAGRYLRSVFPSVPAFGFSGVQFLLLLLAILSSFLSQGGKCTQEEGMGNVESKKKRSKERPRFFEW